MDKNQATIEISLVEYNQLVKDQRFLQCLRAVGVDNWEYFDDAVEMLEQDEVE